MLLLSLTLVNLVLFGAVCQALVRLNRPRLWFALAVRPDLRVAPRRELERRHALARFDPGDGARRAGWTFPFYSWLIRRIQLAHRSGSDPEGDHDCRRLSVI
jgi:hypothetical protein